jgi:hypothetical protein
MDGERLAREMKVNWELQGCCDHDQWIFLIAISVSTVVILLVSPPTSSNLHSYRSMLPRFRLTGASILCSYVEAVLAYVQAYQPFCSIASSESPPVFYAFYFNKLLALCYCSSHGRSPVRFEFGGLNFGNHLVQVGGKSSHLISVGIMEINITFVLGALFMLFDLLYMAEEYTMHLCICLDKGILFSHGIEVAVFSPGIESIFWLFPLFSNCYC